jgi:uncharacterized protein YyaL (SSP411 family)
MKDERGFFYSAIDADSDHKEGAFYVWTNNELEKLIPKKDFAEFSKTFQILESGNFEEHNILYTQKLLSNAERERWAPILKSLYEHREKRQRPLTDRKIQTSWNGLMISALARASEILKRPHYREAAERAASAILQTAWDGKRLSHSQMGERTLDLSFLEDAAYFLEGLLDLADASKDKAKVAELFEFIFAIAEFSIREFYDSEAGGFWTTMRHQKDLLIRSKEIHDGALPAPYHLMLSVLERLYAKTGDPKFYEPLEKSFKAVLGEAEERPGGFHRFALVYQKFTSARYACAVGGDC